jgi:PKD repeat protein
LLSCEKIPVAQFHTDTTKPEVGEAIEFISDSKHATSFEWDFGDGYFSNDVNPIHVYTGTVPVTVTLKAFSKSGLSDESFLDMVIMIPTLLEIEVREFYQEYVVPNADVWLYSSIIDWDKHNDNFISVGRTDASGTVVFSGLDPFVYYVDVYETHHDNQLLRNEDIGFVRTSEIVPYQINRFTAWVDYYASKGSGDRSTTRSLVIKKLERKASEKGTPLTNAGTEGWQELYNRGVVQK